MVQPAQPVLAIVTPCFNEEAIIVSTVQTLTALLDKLIRNQHISPKSFIIFVDDGSRDQTVSLLRAHKNEKVKILKLAGNVGHQQALLAGLHYVCNKADCCISLDADLQDDTGVIATMVDEFVKGNHIVYGVRGNRDTDSTYKRATAELFYKFMLRMGVPLIYNHADFRLVSNQVLIELKKYSEVNLFLRGIFPLMGYPSSQVYYTRKKREAGKSKYPFWKMVHFAVTGITSFTNYPLKIIMALGAFVFLGSLLATAWVIWVVLTGRNVPGWASITLPIYLLGGIQLLAVGVLGEYISKVYLETKGRPLYHVEEIVD
jgi:glycosyltransferase involved in cell wall biosynthesis